MRLRTELGWILQDGGIAEMKVIFNGRRRLRVDEPRWHRGSSRSVS